jgi:hypothetical protein
MIDPARGAISHGVSPNVRNYFGETPLLLAATDGHGEMVKVLLLNGANPALPDMFGQTPLNAARAKGHADIVEVLSSAALRVDLNAAPTPWRPNARLWLVACIVLGITWVVGLTYFSFLHPISKEQFFRLVEAKQIQDVREDHGYLVGVLRDRFQSGRDPVWVPSKKFWLAEKVYSTDIKLQNYAQTINPNYLAVESSWRLPSEAWKGSWVILMLAGPIVFLGIPLWLLIRWNRYPFFALSSSRRRAVPGEPSSGTSAIGAGNVAR